MNITAEFAWPGGILISGEVWTMGRIEGYGGILNRNIHWKHWFLSLLTDWYWD